MRVGKFFRERVLPVAVAATIIGGAVVAASPDKETGGPLPNGSPKASALPDQKVKVDGKVYTKTARTHVKLTAKDLDLAHDGIIRHAVGRGTGPNTTWSPNEPSYPPAHDWWMEGEAYILHRQAYTGNPPVQLDYYRAGFDLWGWRGAYAYDTTWGDEETKALVGGDIYFALVEHPLGGTLTTNKTGPWKVRHSTPGNYYCGAVSPEVWRLDDPNVVLRTNLIVRPVFTYWKSDDGTFHAVPYGQTRRMLQSKGLIADGSFPDAVVDEAYSNHWSEFVGIPGNSGTFPDYCASEVIQEP